MPLFTKIWGNIGEVYFYLNLFIEQLTIGSKNILIATQKTIKNII